RNGLMLAGRKVERTSLGDGDILTIAGQVSLKYSETAPQGAAEGASEEGSLEVCGETIVGRATESGLHIDHPAVSLRHARVTLAPDGSMAIEDLGSTNGTFVNGG